MRHCLLAATMLTILACCGAAHAQPQSLDTSKPIVIKNPKASKPKPGKFVGQVLSSTPRSITIRSQDNLMAVRTFAYAENLNAPGLQYGQNVEIDYTPGSDIVSRIKILHPNRR
jgi:hypothetical protein